MSMLWHNGLKRASVRHCAASSSTAADSSDMALLCSGLILPRFPSSKGSSTAGSSSIAVLWHGLLWHGAPLLQAPSARRSSAAASSGTASLATSSSGTTLPYSALIFFDYVLRHSNFLHYPFLRCSPLAHLSYSDKGSHMFPHRIEVGRRAALNEGFIWNM
ncbi:unnamed protein product [Victoria cruziana]